MKDSLLEIISIITIIIGLCMGFILVFDYTPSDSFFLEENDDNAYLEGLILSIKVKNNYTLLDVYGCKTFEVYSEKYINKSANESIILHGSFTDGLFILENYK